jgi:NTP pyrophosphatase (non-canonical NTP hydrolase)
MNKGQFELLRAANAARGLEWSGEPSIKNLGFRALEIFGESGELADAVKKYIRHCHGWPGGKNLEESLEDISAELADCMISADRVAELFELELYEEVIGCPVPAIFMFSTDPEEQKLERVLLQFGKCSGDLQGHLEVIYSGVCSGKVTERYFVGCCHHEDAPGEYFSFYCARQMLFMYCNFLHLIANHFGIDLFIAVKRKFNQTSDKHGFQVKL